MGCECISFHKFAVTWQGEISLGAMQVTLTHSVLEKDPGHNSWPSHTFLAESATELEAAVQAREHSICSWTPGSSSRWAISFVIWSQGLRLIKINGLHLQKRNKVLRCYSEIMHYIVLDETPSCKAKQPSAGASCSIKAFGKVETSDVAIRNAQTSRECLWVFLNQTDDNCQETISLEKMLQRMAVLQLILCIRIKGEALKRVTLTPLTVN